MHAHLLFIDIEASDLPKRWDRPYSAKDNWPYAIQVSWILYSKDGQQLKTENHYIYDPSITICKKSKKIHGLTKEFLQRNGKSRNEVLGLLSLDMQTYRPMVVGHFVEMEFHVLSADYYRIGKPNPMDQLPLFCTMLATKGLVRNPAKKYLRLMELYQSLFDKDFSNPHNAYDDAHATAECFFELVRRKEIDPSNDHKHLVRKPEEATPRGCSFPSLVWGVLIFILLMYL